MVRARTARVESSAGQVADRPFEADGLVGRVGREDQRARRRRPGADPLGEPLAVVLDEPDGPLDDQARAAVVDLEVDPAEPGQQASASPRMRRTSASRQP